MSIARVGLPLVIALGFATSLPAQNLSPAYLNDMPTVERVKRDIQGKDATDSLARQVAILGYLPFVIQRMMGPQFNPYKDKYTPDQLKLMQVYGVAAYELSQAYTKSHTPAEAKAFEQLHGRYEMDSAFMKEWFNKLFPPAFVAQYSKATGALLADYAAHVEKKQQEYEEAQRAPAAQGNGTFVRNDPGTLAARRCVESGKSELECIGQGLKVGLMDLAGMNTNTTSPPARLVVTGVYGDATMNLSFGDDSASLTGCGKLVPNGHDYKVTRSGNRIQLQMQNSPQPFTMTLADNGTLVGPGLVDVLGQVIVGYRQQWVEKRYTADNSVVPGSGHYESVPVYAPKTERCSIATLRPLGPTGTFGSAIKMASNVMTGQSVEAASDKAVKDLPPPGLRLLGSYASPGGLKVDFESESAMVECGEAHVAESYLVDHAGGAIQVRFPKNSQPFALSVEPNGGMSGNGTVEVAGRVVTGSRADGGIAYAPRVARCSLGNGAAASAMTSASASGQAANGNGELQILSGIPAQPGYPNRLNGATFYMLRDSFAHLLAQNGFRPVNGSMIQGWGASCNRQLPDCVKGNQIRQNAVVSQAKFDIDGKAALPGLSPGTYHLFGWTQIERKHLVWDVAVEVKPGANKIVLDARNAETVQ